jgi:GrpB-like predicted nucleotidyltransferase (UPF0157 family)
MARVRLVAYDERSPDGFERHAAAIREVLGRVALRIDHVGSTSVPGLVSKDVIDMQTTVASLDPSGIQDALARLGYECTAPDGYDHVPAGRVGREADWRKVFFLLAASDHRVHLHVRAAGAPNQRYALLFRDYLRVHADAAAAYASLKTKLSELDPPLSPMTYADVKDPACDIIVAAAEDWADATNWEPGPSDA